MMNNIDEPYMVHATSLLRLI